MMTRFIRTAFISSFLFFLSFSVQAQGFGEDVRIEGYSTGIGVRTGTEAGLTLKQFISQRSALEAILSSSLVSSRTNKGLNAALLYELHNYIGYSDRFLWFIGAGGHIGLYNEEGNRTFFSRSEDSFLSLGLDAIGGVEYKIPIIPITLGLDVKPSIDLKGRTEKGFLDAALSGRFVF